MLHLFRRLPRVLFSVLTEIHAVCTRSCRHPEPSWPTVPVGTHLVDPYRGRQHCPVCGSFRFYVIGAGALSPWLRPRAARH